MSDNNDFELNEEVTRESIDDLEYRQQRREKRAGRRLKKKRKRIARLIIALIFVLIIAGGAVIGIRMAGRAAATASEETSDVISSETGAEAENESESEVPSEDEPPVEIDPLLTEAPTMPADVIKIAEAFDTEPTIVTRLDEDGNEEEVEDYSNVFHSEYGVLINVDTNTVVAEKNSNDRIYPASMTKVLTLLTIADAIDESDMGKTATMTQEIWDANYINDLSACGYQDGEQPYVRDLLYGIILPSGADACVMMANYVSGSEENFVSVMNDNLGRIGLTQTQFKNCTGLFAEEHWSTPTEIARIMESAIKNDLCRTVLTTPEYYLPTTELCDYERYIENAFMWRIYKMDTGTATILGAKTGFEDEAMYCAVSFGEGADGTTYVCCTAFAPSAWDASSDHALLYRTFC